eukprot:Skav228481  [mRNA]  locus=scaffold1092:61890:85306:- [translate_table: standard]
MVSSGVVSVGTTVSLAMYCFMAGSSYTGMMTAYGDIQKCLGSCQKVLDILGSHSEVKPQICETVAAATAVPLAVKFEDVSFVYPARPTAHVLQGLTLDVPAGSRVAVLGRSGSGKSTIALLLAGLYEPISGRILVDGQDMFSDVNTTAWVRSQLGVISQEPTLFAMSIRQNVEYGLNSSEPSQDGSDDNQLAVKEAAAVAHVNEFADFLPLGMDTLAGERGQALSGGQKQRVCIARALAPKPRMLIFDEATSALDLRSERAVHQALQEVLSSGDCTCLVITHSILRNDDPLEVEEPGPEGGRRQAKQDGILPRAAAELFRRIARLEAEAKAAIGAGGFSAYEVRVSFLEVYCENAFDLLSGPVSASRESSSACSLREASDGRVYADGAKEERIKSCEQLLETVAAGARARATAATGVHAHSSRSHALLVVSVEHRWRDVGETDASKFHTQIARLTLVDLAGAESMERAHGGSFDAAGVGTNMGLLVLGRVIRALAEGSERVPYRDSSLTRLMQSSLGGRAKTQMLACVSPVVTESDVTLHTLKYAFGARSVLLKPEAASIETAFDSDPMITDVEDDDQALNRRCIWIETADFGDVFARCVGDPKDPLILYIHGSGPCNSSMFWNKLVMDVAMLASAGAGDLPKSFYQVAIDCPGYARSPGDKQSIRSYPGALISNIVRALGRKTVACQGACATLNCALECPKLMHTLAVVHPVGHAPHRYGAIAQPSLLIFDTEDAGHPVSVGRQMRRHLPNPRMDISRVAFFITCFAKQQIKDCKPDQQRCQLFDPLDMREDRSFEEEYARVNRDLDEEPANLQRWRAWLSMFFLVVMTGPPIAAFFLTAKEWVDPLVRLVPPDDTEQVKDIFFGGSAWLVSCVTNKSAAKAPRVLEAAAEVLRPRGVRVARVHCWHPLETKKGKRTLAQRFGFRDKPPVVMATKGTGTPTFLAATGLPAEALAAKALAAVIPDAEDIPQASIREGRARSKRRETVGKRPKDMEDAEGGIQVALLSQSATMVNSHFRMSRGLGGENYK